ncbi:hypothetical protein BGZ82_011413 [Podila clonocystis]|nr:hypothetical protein BGZ82_011413 [Podila clonocystis]
MDTLGRNRTKKTPTAKAHAPVEKSNKPENPTISSSRWTVTRAEKDLMRDLIEISERSDNELKDLLALAEDFAAKLKDLKCNKKVKRDDPQRICMEQLLKLVTSRYRVASDVGHWFHDVGDVYEEHRECGGTRTGAELAVSLLMMVRGTDTIVRRRGVSEVALDHEFESLSL